MPYVFGADITFKGDEKYAVDPMGVCDTIEEAVLGNRKLHSSFGYNIYEVEPQITKGLTRSFGIRIGTRCVGYKVTQLACHAYEHPAWKSISQANQVEGKES